MDSTVEAWLDDIITMIGVDLVKNISQVHWTLLSRDIKFTAKAITAAYSQIFSRKRRFDRHDRGLPERPLLVTQEDKLAMTQADRAAARAPVRSPYVLTGKGSHADPHHKSL